MKVFIGLFDTGDYWLKNDWQGEVDLNSRLIDEIEEPLDEFDDKLFEEIIVEMSLNNTDELTITLLGGLKFTELI